MKLEIDEDKQQYRLVDGVEGTSSYCTGPTVSFGEQAVLERDNKPDASALIPSSAASLIDALLETVQLSKEFESEALEFEFACELPEPDEDDDTDEDEEQEETTV